MSEEQLIEVMENFSLLGLVLAFFVFLRLAIRARSLGSFRFQLSIFMLVWILAEGPHIAATIGLIPDPGFGLYGLTLHMLSMFSFALFVGARSYRFLRTLLPAFQPLGRKSIGRLYRGRLWTM